MHSDFLDDDSVFRSEPDEELLFPNGRDLDAEDEDGPVGELTIADLPF